MVANKVLIVGAGVLGVTTATVFARAGHAVTVVDAADGPATGVTSLGSGGFRHPFPYAEETQFAAATVAGWQQLERTYNTSFGLNYNGYLLLATGETDVAALEQRAAHLRTLGVDHRLLSSAEVRAMMPGLRGSDVSGDTAVAALFTPEDGYTSPPAVVKHLSRIASEEGADFRYATRVVEVLTSGDAVTGLRVETNDGVEQLSGDLLINTAGLRAPHVGEMVGDVLPVTAWRQHQFRTNDLAESAAVRFPCVFDPGHSLYARPDAAGVLVGYHEDAEAWAENYTPTPQMERACLTMLKTRWPDLAEVGLLRHWVGCYEVTPDWRALIGLSSKVTGSAYLCGMSGHGLMNSLGAAQQLRRLTDGEEPDIDLRPFDAERFAAA